MSLFGGSTNSDTNKSNQDDKPKESGAPAGGIAQKDFALLFAKKEDQPTTANGEETKKLEGTEKPNVFGGLFSTAPKSPAKEEKKDESPTKPSGGLFSNHQGGSLFGNLGSNTGTFTVPSTLGSGLLGGNVTAAPTLSGGLFGNLGPVTAAPTNTDAAATTGTGTADAAAATGTTGTTASPQKGGLFSGGALGGLFGSASATPATGGGLFGAGLGGGLFGGGGGATTATTGTTGGGLFGGGAATASTNTGGGLFGSGAGAATGTGGLFGNNSPPKLGAGGLNISTLKGNVQYVPNLNAPTTGKTGTVNYDLKFGKSNENYEIYSITCASNADKNKSIEELRAEDYELIRTGELPEALQLKIIDNRERLEKNLGFVLPVPTPSNKTYTKIFKSTTRNTSMKSTFMNNKYADVKFKVENEEIPAHRNVLGLCSPFFDDLFTKHQSDTLPLVIEIPDIKAETFKAILEFLYTGEVNLHEDLAVDLILHGQRFDVMDLVQAADDFISKMINIDNYMKVLEISDRLSSKPLRKKVFTFIVRNMKMISKREDFEELPRGFLMEILENAIAA